LYSYLLPLFVPIQQPIKPRESGDIVQHHRENIPHDFVNEPIQSEFYFYFPKEFLKPIFSQFYSIITKKITLLFSQF
jgi:hypothetical protein